MHRPRRRARRTRLCAGLRGRQRRHHCSRSAMSARLLVGMPGNEAMTRALAQRLDAAIGDIELRAFPDGETYLRFLGALSGCSLAVVCTLDRPNDKILPLLFAAATAREL